MRKGIGNIFILIGSMLILLSLLCTKFFADNSMSYYNSKEGGMAYGILMFILGMVFKYRKKITILKLMWGTWAYLFFLQILRLLPKQVFISRFMNSITLFWCVVILGMILLNLSIWWKIRKIF